MKTPPTPFTIHVIELHDVVPYIAAPRPSAMIRVRPYIAQAFTGAGRGLVQSGRVAVFAVTAFFRLFLHVGSVTIRAIRGVYHALVVMLEFVFVKIPLFVLGLIALGMIIGFVYMFVDAVYHGYQHRPLHGPTTILSPASQGSCLPQQPSRRQGFSVCPDLV